MPSADFADMLVGIGAKRIGSRAWIACCPSHDDHSPSLTIYEGKEGQPVFVCGRCEWRDVRDALRTLGLMKGTLAKRRRGTGAGAGTAEHAAPPAAHPDYSKAALRIWDGSHSIVGTMVERYLAARGLSHGLVSASVIRFHPRCPRGKGRDAVYRPAMIALMRDIASDKPVAIHRTFLTDDCRKDGKPLMLGSSNNAAVKLAPDADLLCPKLCVCEGVETALAGMMLGHTPMWALGSAGAIERFPVLFWIDELTVCADNDANLVGQNAARACIGRWYTAGKKTHAVIPDDVGADLADLIGDGHG